MRALSLDLRSALVLVDLMVPLSVFLALRLFLMPAAGRSQQQRAGALHELGQATEEVGRKTGLLTRSLSDSRSTSGGPGRKRVRRFSYNNCPDPSALLGSDLGVFRYRGHFRWQGGNGVRVLHGGGGGHVGGFFLVSGNCVRQTGGAEAAVHSFPLVTPLPLHLFEKSVKGQFELQCADPSL